MEGRKLLRKNGTLQVEYSTQQEECATNLALQEYSIPQEEY